MFFDAGGKIAEWGFEKYRGRYFGEKISPCGHRTSMPGPKNQILCVRIRKIQRSLFLGEKKSPCGHRTSSTGSKKSDLMCPRKFPKCHKIGLGHEMGRRGSKWAHTLGKRSHGPRDHFKIGLGPHKSKKSKFLIKIGHFKALGFLWRFLVDHLPL